MKNKNLARFLKIAFKKNKYISIIAFVIMIVTSIIELFMPQITKIILDDAIKFGNIKLLVNLILLYITTNLLLNTLSIVLQYIYSKMKNRVSIIFKIKLIRHLAKLSGNYYTNIKTGNILNILENDMYIVESLGADLLFSLIVDFFTATIAFFFLMKMQYDLLIIIVIIQALILLTQSKFTKLISLKNEKLRDDSGDISNISQEYISNIMNVVISKSNLKFFKQYLNKERKMLKNSIGLDMAFSTSMATGSILSSFITVAIYGYGGYKIINGSMTFGELIAFQQYTGIFISPCMNIIRSNIKIEQAKTSINRIFTVLDEPIIIDNNNNGIRCSDSFKGNISFNNVTFSYEDKGNTIDNINMKFENGKITALVGSSGCGKSTIAKLLFRLWDVNSGDIIVDSVSLKDYNLKNIRENISIITQDVLLFDDTIINNLILNNKGINDDYLAKVCKSVGIYELVNSLPNGFNTIIGEKGVKLSGGQKQRISIGRALLCDSKIIIFDEATSALDNISQRDILENINEFLEYKTVIVIAHRLSTIKDADKIYVLEKGKVIEEGCHEQLILNEGIYCSLLDEQSLEVAFA
ncbi:ABC transporter ATP-binding protein [Romboutsia weinsteinii]|uniref:ABC transporter ATP-binding protein n=1 Tax=Romboutsia weinsteinii TaxID=2020949 RepID=A0A371J4G2_9FIRM|nr:ABC transporter ATP-binding protein [Romboutsia weinsteinii]RDY27603.1 ABC transporter ATP-binding protein [Romboutsia weinsteinii]